MDPFCKIVFNHGGTDPKEYQTEVKKEAGKTPVWNETYTNIVYSGQ